jgi:enoyl-CoA hydratase
VHPFESLRLAYDGALAHLVLTGPGKGNAMGPAFFRELPQAIAMLDAREDVRCIVLSGDGAHFSFGLDVAAMLEADGGRMARDGGADDRAAFLEQLTGMQRAFLAVAHARKPVVAAIRGWCIGSGIELAAACDIRYCAPDARFALKEVELAIVADLGGLQRLPHLVGEGHARELALTGRTIDAERAERIGLVNDVARDGDVLDLAAATAATIANHAPPAVAGVKRNMNASMGRPIEDGLHYTAVWNAAFFKSDALAAALASFGKR